MRTAIKATGRSAASSKVATGAPRISILSWKGSESNVNEQPSSPRWSGGASPGAPMPHHSPAERLLQESDRRTGHAVMRIEMRPGSDEAFARGLEPGQQPGNRIAVGIGPAAYGIHRAGDGAIVFADRSMLPVIVPPGVFEPH